MSEPAHQPVPGDEAVPVAVSHDEKTLEMAAVPEPMRTDQDTVPVRSSLEKILRHEMLRHQSARNEGGDR